MKTFATLLAALLFASALPAMAQEAKEVVIVLDPGHGGYDGGAVGYSGSHEKDIALEFAKRLREQILHRQPDYKIHLTRERDEAVSLPRRIGMARRLQADLFLSIHADWSANPNVRGFAAYSAEEGASPAYNPQKPDRYMQAALPNDSQPEAVNAILHDLVARQSRHQSGILAQTILASASTHAPLLERPHRLARFRVLAAPDIPAVLLELGFLTNQQDDKNLAQRRWQIKLARRIAEAVEQAIEQPHAASHQRAAN